MRLRVFSLFVLFVLAMNLPAQASQWYPIDTGRIWVYGDAGGASFSGTIGTSESFAGSLVQPLHWDRGSCEYLSQDKAGRVFLHGVTYPDGSYVIFNPPFLRMDSELTVGHEWETTTEVVWYAADGVETLRQQGSLIYHVLAIGTVEVAAGTFHSAEVLVTEERVSLAGAALSSGASLLSSAQQGTLSAKRIPYMFRDTYAAGVGWILRTDENGSSMIFELETYGVSEVATETTSWGAVKSLFR